MARRTTHYTINVIGFDDAAYAESRLARMAQTVYDIVGQQDGVVYRAVKKENSPCVGAHDESR